MTLRVTEHAMLRYLQRRYGFKPADVVADMLPPDLRALIETLGDGNYRRDGLEYRVRGGRLVTVVDPATRTDERMGDG